MEVFVSAISISKTMFKPKMFEYLRMVEKNHDTVLLTDHGRPVAEVIPFGQSSRMALEKMRGLVSEYVDPLDPVDEKWDADL
jgi:prevent-host-death family protein